MLDLGALFVWFGRSGFVLSVRVSGFVILFILKEIVFRVLILRALSDWFYC